MMDQSQEVVQEDQPRVFLHKNSTILLPGLEPQNDDEEEDYEDSLPGAVETSSWSSSEDDSEIGQELTMIEPPALHRLTLPEDGETEEDEEMQEPPKDEQRDEASLTSALSKEVEKESETKKKDEKKRVQFKNITVHYHAMALGDCPWVKRGAPIALSSHCIKTKEYSNLEHFESLRRKQRKGKDKGEIKRYNGEQRLALLRLAGVSDQDIFNSAKESQALRLEMLRNSPRCKSKAAKKAETKKASQSPPEPTASCHAGVAHKAKSLLACHDDYSITNTSPNDLQSFWFDWICNHRSSTVARSA